MTRTSQPGRTMVRPHHLLAVAFTLLGLAIALPARAVEAAPAQTIWRLLDYVAVDYAGAVANGRVTSESEYAEQAEFAASARERMAELPPTPVLPQLQAQADALKAAIAAKASPVEVAGLARALGRDLLAAYPVPLAPTTPPGLARGRALYAENCAACHGATGQGDGPVGVTLEPRPVAFSDAGRARQRSVFALEQVIEQGLDGTPMVSFAHLPADDRWALAFVAGSFAFTPGDIQAGEALWRARPDLPALFPNLEALTQTSQAALEEKVGASDAQALLAYLRTHPDAVMPKANDSLAIARAKLGLAVKAYEAGDAKAAGDLALAAYLDGFEPVEPILKARDGGLMTRVESAMGAFRGVISQGRPADEVRAQAQAITGLLTEAEHALSPAAASDASTFVGAFTILLREGLEALLIVVAMIAFLRKAGRADVLRHVHLGWTTALAAGLATWAAATYLVSISGASRELTEGLGSVFAALVLLSVGVWMHGKSQAGAWQLYIKEKLSHALSRQSAWFLFLLTFVVVYREVFETILFYMALWAEGAHMAVLAGAGAAVLLLAAIAWGLLRYSRRLPIGAFFAWSSGLMAVLAVVLAGKGVKALQEAGWLDVIPLVHVPSVEIVGLFPTAQTVAAQAVMAAALAAGFAYNALRAGRKA
ncbi:FTR1 family protein [Nitrospirillum sp. BR 11163]|uniref:FTR1 family protein n=1 Tax=Nitrospirillum sp. BR 11163 TaxID=3104323 RepID=UPI002B001301|nr:FTR1 family protein [Nitrospirillum sp. BR 11163]MEA1673747.1 FTR1 family protein [Nitrospirillum sp. BR 11163]